MKRLVLLLLMATTVANAGTDKDVKCLADNAFYEARNQGIKGMQAVIDVTLNRVESSKFPDSACSVVYQRKQFSWTHQPRQKVKKQELEIEYQVAKYLARQMLSGYNRGTTKGALFYHANYVRPKWASQMKQVKQIKSHIFYVANN